MASYTVTTSKHATLVASTVDTVTLGADFAMVEIQNRDATTLEIYATVNGATPTVAGDGTLVLRPGQVRTVDVAGTGPTTVRLISSGTPAYSVTGI